MKAKKITGPIVIESVSPDDVENHKIYSVNASKSLGGGNRVKTITVTGIPGSTFTLMTQDENNQLFSFKQGAFGPTPSPLTGVIPLSGVFTKKINTGRAKKVDVRLQSAGLDAVTEVVTQTMGNQQFTINVDGTDLSNYTIFGATSHVSSVAVGGNALLTFDFTVKANTGKLVNYVRAPKFSYDQSTPEKFVLYDGVAFAENALAHSTNQAGKQLQSDFKITEATGWETTGFKIIKLNVDTAGSSFGKIPDPSVGHSTWVSDSLRVKGQVDISKMGTENLTLNLMLYNFLEIL
jgi:hypothetical protein